MAIIKCPPSFNPDSMGVTKGVIYQTAERIGDVFYCVICGQRAVLGIGCCQTFVDNGHGLRKVGPACRECTEKLDEIYKDGEKDE